MILHLRNIGVKSDAMCEDFGWGANLTDVGWLPVLQLSETKCKPNKITEEVNHC